MRRFRVKVSYDLDILAKSKRDAVKVIEDKFAAPTTEWRDPPTGFTTNFRAGPAGNDMKVAKIEPWSSSPEE